MNTDEYYMERCVALADMAAEKGDFPFGALIVYNNTIIIERFNEALVSKEVCRHAEMLALTDAQKILTKEQLAQCTLYCTVEPCPMCSFAIQELNIHRVVFGLRSPIMGGYTKWPILQDEELPKTFPRSFGKVPEIRADVLKDKIIESWKRWNTEKWQQFVAKKVFN
jgi:tRNA(adenine34) deaminase